MAIYHFTARMVRRKEKRVVTQVAAYKFGDRIKCEKTGETYDYTKNTRVIWAALRAPSDAPDWISDRQALWNAVEARETRKDAQVAREYELALPAELGRTDHIQMLERFTDHLVGRFSLVVEWAIHAPRRQSDQRNYIAVLLMPTRRMEGGQFTTKVREMSVLPGAAIVLRELRQLWADIVNDALEQAGLDDRVDHRTLAQQKAVAELAGDADLAALLDREPGKKLDRVEFQARRNRIARSSFRDPTFPPR